MKTPREIALVGIMLAGVFIAGFIGGRCSREGRSKEGKVVTIAESLPAHQLQPSAVDTPARRQYVIPRQREEPPLVRELRQEEDTTKAIEATVDDWNLIRKYSGVLFEKEQTGTLKYDAIVTRNRLTDFRYEYTPAIPIRLEKRWRPFIGLQYYSNEQIGTSVGVLYKHVGLQINVLSTTGKNGYAVGIGAMVVF